MTIVVSNATRTMATRSIEMSGNIGSKFTSGICIRLLLTLRAIFIFKPC